MEKKRKGTAEVIWNIDSKNAGWCTNQKSIKKHRRD